jgi:hypothetical protein
MNRARCRLLLPVRPATPPGLPAAKGCSSWGWALAVLLTNASVGFAAENAISPDLSRVDDGKVWSGLNADCQTAVEDGKRVARLKPKAVVNTPSNIAIEAVEGVEFGEGTLEIDLKGKGKFETSFPGVAFHVVDGKTFEAVYFRPFNFMRDDKSYRVRAVQYVCWPENTWEKLRKETPGVYEAAVKPVPDPSGWFHARIEVTKQKVRVWVDDAKEPSLVVDRLTGREKGKVGLWVDGKECAFSNLKILPTK